MELPHDPAATAQKDAVPIAPGGRRRFLSKAAKEKAASKRVSGACKVCRERKVSDPQHGQWYQHLAEQQQQPEHQVFNEAFNPPRAYTKDSTFPSGASSKLYGPPTSAPDEDYVQQSPFQHPSPEYSYPQKPPHPARPVIVASNQVHLRGLHLAGSSPPSRTEVHQPDRGIDLPRKRSSLSSEENTGAHHSKKLQLMADSSASQESAALLLLSLSSGNVISNGPTKVNRAKDQPEIAEPPRLPTSVSAPTLTHTLSYHDQAGQEHALSYPGTPPSDSTTHRKMNDFTNLRWERRSEVVSDEVIDNLLDQSRDSSEPIITLWIVTRTPDPTLHPTHELWREGRLSGNSLSSFLTNLSSYTARPPDIVKINLTLNTPILDIKITIHKQAEEHWVDAKKEFVKKLREIRVDISECRILIEPEWGVLDDEERQGEHEDDFDF
ncbi:hypothetical protein IFR05_017136 [Cadophora sp. M221]|nr:hypothetical protein IFR05_017136 [Cadophora sp. M221]